jgi:uncharacterized RDD family membrane protein YckC
MTDSASSVPHTPGLARRLAAFVYEGILLFALVMITALVYSPLVGQRNAMEHRTGLIITLGIVIGAYFVFFWTRSGQTLPLKTWHIRLIRLDGRPLSIAQALLRYVLSYLWWVLPIVTALQMRQHGLGFGAISVVGILGLLAYALLSRVLPGRQFLHDVICKTQLITQLPPPKKPKA